MRTEWFVCAVLATLRVAKAQGCSGCDSIPSHGTSGDCPPTMNDGQTCRPTCDLEAGYLPERATGPRGEAQEFVRTCTGGQCSDGAILCVHESFCNPNADPPNMCPPAGSVACPNCGGDRCECPEPPEPVPEPEPEPVPVPTDCHDCDSAPDHGARGTCTQRDYGPGHVCQPTCNTGYEPTDQQGKRGVEFNRICTAGHCSDSGIHCERALPEPEPEPDNDCHDCDSAPDHGARGTCTQRDYGPGHVCQPTCNTGYEPTDQQGKRGVEFNRTCTARSCTDSGTRCEPVRCGVAPEKNHTIYPDGCTNKVYHEKCNATCDAEFSTSGRLDGSTVQTIECDSNGKWSSLEPCLPIGCPIPANVLDNWPGAVLGGAEPRHGPFGCGINTCGEGGDAPCIIGDGKSCEVICREGYGDEDSGQTMGLRCSSDENGVDELDTKHLPNCALCDETHYKPGNNTHTCSACDPGFRTGRRGATDKSECRPYVTVKSISSTNADPHIAVAGDVVTVVLQASSGLITDVEAAATVTTWRKPFAGGSGSWEFSTDSKDSYYDRHVQLRTFTFNYSVPAVGPLNTTLNTVPAQDEPNGRFWLLAASMTYNGGNVWKVDIAASNGTTAEDGSYVVVKSEKAKCPDPAANNYNRDLVPDRLALGGWCQAWGNNKCHWDTSTASIVLAGGFMADCRAFPAKSPWILQGPQRFYLVLGGYGVGGDFNPRQSFEHCATEATQEIVDYLLETRAEGISFDLEGWLDPKDLDVSALKSFVDDLKDQLPELKVALTPADSDWESGRWHHEDVKDWVDFITPMMYGDAQTYQGRGYQGRDYVAILETSILRWTGEAGWPPHKVFLTYQSDSANGGLKLPLNNPRHDVIHYLAQQVKEKHFAGLLGWPAGPVNMHNTNCPQGFRISNTSGCCEASCDTSKDCSDQMQRLKGACEQNEWMWKTFGDDKDYKSHAYTCCRCGEPPCSSDPARATTLAIQAVAAAQLGVETAQASASNNHDCHYSCSGLMTHFGLSELKPDNCFIGRAGMPAASFEPLQSSPGETLVFQGSGRSPVLVRIEADHSDLVIRHIRMSNLRSSSAGGALALTGGRLIVEYSEFLANTGSSGGAISTKDATEVCIGWSRFTNNHASPSGLLLADTNSGGGGALMLANTEGRVTISDSTFDSNTAITRAGAVLIDVGETLGRFLEPIVIANCGGRDNQASTGSAVQVAGYTVPEESLNIGQNSQWALASITAASQGCPLPLSKEEMRSEPGHTCNEKLELGQSCRISCMDSDVTACSYGEKQQLVNCTRASGGAAVLLRSGVCSGKQCSHATAVATCGTHLTKAEDSLGGECCEIGGTSVCHCPVDWRYFGSDVVCGMDECKLGENTSLGTCPAGTCHHSTTFVSSVFAHGYYECKFELFSRMMAVLVTFLASIAPLCFVVRRFHAEIDKCREEPNLSDAGEGLGYWGLFCFLLGICGLAINIGQTITLLLQDEYTLFVCSSVVQFVTFSTTVYFQVLVLREIEDPVHGPNAKLWNEQHKALCNTVRLLSVSRLQSMAVLRVHVKICGDEWKLIDMPMLPKYWRFLRDAGTYIHLISDVPNFAIAVALLHIQVVTRETVGLCEDEHSFLPDLLCGWIPDAFHAPKEVSMSAFAYLQITRSLLSVIYGVVSRIRYCCAKTTSTRPSTGLINYSFTRGPVTRSGLAKPLFSTDSDSEDPAPTPTPATQREKGARPRWPTEVDCMPVEELRELKTEVAKAQQRYPDGSALLSDERRRLQQAFHIEEDVMQRVFEFVAANSVPVPEPEPEPVADDEEPLFTASATRPASPQRPRPPR